MNIVLLVGSILGLSSIMMAAYVDHGLALYLSGKALNSVSTAVRYHQFYAIIVSMIGLILPIQINYRYKSWLIRVACLFITGTILFSGSIYASVVLNIPGILYFTPIGGVALVIGWIGLIRTAFLRSN